MYTWLSRVMAVVFLLNVLSPAYAQVPASKGNRRLLPGEYRLQQMHNRADSLAGVTQNSYKKRQEYIDEYTESMSVARDAFIDAGSFEEMDAAYKQIEQLRATGGGVMSMYQRQISDQLTEQLNAQNAASAEYFFQNPAFAPDAISQTMGRDMRYPLSREMIAESVAEAAGMAGSALCPSSEEFLQKYSADEMGPLENYLEYLDPMGMNCKDYLVVAYAAEGLFRELQSFKTEGSLEVLGQDPEEFKSFLAHARYRGLQSLHRLEAQKQVTDHLVKAKGTLRILLSQIEVAARANNIQLPEKKLYYVFPSKGTWMAYKRNAESKNTPSRFVEKDVWISGVMNILQTYDEYVQSNSYFVETLPANMPKGWKAEEVTSSSINGAAFNAAYQRFAWNPAPNWLAKSGAVVVPNAGAVLEKSSNGDLGRGFIKELEAFKAKNPKEDSDDFSLLQLEMNYATQFAVLTGDFSMLNQMLALFEEPASSENRLTDFKTHYSSVVGVLFGTLQDTLQYFAVASDMAVFEFLEQAIAFPHGTNTRVMALAALGYLNTGAKTNNASSYPNFATKQSDINGMLTKEFYLSDATRAAAAASIMDLLAPLQSYRYQDYGLDSDQMQKLAEMLFGNLQKFLPVPGRVDTYTDAGLNKDERLVTANDFYGVQGGYIFAAGKPKRLPKIYIWDKDGKGHGPVEAQNWKNYKKTKDETDSLILNIFGESAMWLLSGVVIGAAFKGLRLLVAAGRNIPRGLKAGRVVFRASKGSTLTRLGNAANRTRASVKTGMKYNTSNKAFTQYLAQNGVNITPGVDAAGKPIIQAGVKTTGTAARTTAAPSPVTSVAVRAEYAVGAARPVSPLSKYFNLNIIYPDGFGSRFTLKLGNLSGWSNPRIRAELLRKAGRYGWKPWTQADRMLAYETSWWEAYINKFGSEALMPRGFSATVRTPIFGINGNISGYYYTNRFVSFADNPHLGSLYQHFGAMGRVSSGMEPGRLFMSSPLLSGYGKAYWNTVKFFLGFRAADIGASATYKPFVDDWMARRAEEEQRKEMEKYGDVFSDEAMAARESGAEVLPSPADVLTHVIGNTPTKESFGWSDFLTLPSWLWEQVSPTRALSCDGAALTPIIVGGWEFLHQKGVIKSSPFIQDKDKQQLSIDAATWRFNDAHRRFVESRLAHNKQDLDQVFKDKRAEIEELRAYMKTVFASWGDIMVAESREYNKILDDFLKDLNQLEASSEEDGVKFSRFTELNTMYSDKIQAFNQQYNARVESFNKNELQQAFTIESLFASIDYLAGMYFQQFSAYPDFQQELRNLFTSYRQELEAMQAKGVTSLNQDEMAEWSKRLKASLNELEEKNGDIILRESALRIIAETERDAAIHEVDISAIVKEWKQEITRILSSSDTVQEKRRQLEDLQWQMFGKVEELLWAAKEDSKQKETEDVDRSELYQTTEEEAIHSSVY